MTKLADMSGPFGRLKVIERLNKKKGSHYVYKCECECGAMVEVNGSSLRSGKTTSCGCYGKEVRAAANARRKEESQRAVPKPRKAPAAKPKTWGPEFLLQKAWSKVTPKSWPKTR